MLMFYAALRGGNSSAQVSGNATYIDTYNGDTQATLGTHAVGDIFVACASRDNSSTAPTIPSGWTTILSGGANTLGVAFVYKVATTTNETTGIFTNATSLQVVHIRPTTGWTAGVGGNNTTSSSSNVALSTPSITMTNTDGTSRVVAFYMHRNADIAGLTTAPAGLTHGRTNQDATDTLASYYTADVVTSFTTQTSSFTGTASACRWVAVEVTFTNTGDTTPNAFTFTDQTGVALSSTITSAAITVSGITAPATITVTGGEYDINSSGSFTSASGTVNNGDTVRARHTSSGSNSTATNTQITIGGVSDTFTSTTLAASGDWQLASGHWIPRKKDMVIIHPRPSGESASWAQYKNAHTGLRWSTFIAVGGGAWPLKFELATGPAGMTIGETFTANGDVLEAPSNYGELVWENPTAGTHSITVNVYDQDYNRGGSPSSVATISWTLTVGTSQHVFVDPVNGSDSNDGSINSPFLTIQKLHNNSSSTSTYNGKTVWLRGGTHNFDGMSTNGDRYAMISGGAPVIFVGYPNETAIVNLYEGHIAMNSGAADLMFKDLQIQSAGDWTVDQYQFIAVAATNRHSWHNCTFTSFYGGTGTNPENQAAIHYANNGCRYISIVKCTYTGRMGCILDTYNVEDVLFERCTGTNINTTGEENSSNLKALVYLKDSVLRATIRANTFVTGMTVGHAAFVGVGGQNDGGKAYAFQDIEYCYNKLALFQEASIRDPIEYAGTPGNIYGYRNSCLGDVENEGSNAPAANIWENNVIVGGFTAMLNLTNTNNTTGAGTLDSSANLTGTTRTNYLGIRGAEVA